jgi:hypothetical protein
MKCELAEAKPEFVPTEVRITVETQEEARTLKHLFSCWRTGDRAVCYMKDGVSWLADAVHDQLPERWE